MVLIFNNVETQSSAYVWLKIKIIIVISKF